MTNQNTPASKQDQPDVGKQSGQQQKQGGQRCKTEDQQESQYATPGQSGTKSDQEKQR